MKQVTKDLLIIATILMLQIALFINTITIRNDIKTVQKNQVQIHQQDSIKWVNINNRFNTQIK